MYKIQANASGTRSIEVSDAHLEAIRKYALFKDLIDSSGFVDGLALEKLKLNARSNHNRATKAFSTCASMLFITAT